MTLSRRAFLAALGLGAAGCSSAAYADKGGQMPTHKATFTTTTTATSVPSPTPSATPRLLIKYGQDIPTPTQFVNNKTLYESRPFDGWVITNPGESVWLSSTVVSQATWAGYISPFPSGLTQNTHNWWRLVNTLTFARDWFDDALWATIASNVGNLAAALVASGKQWDGIFFDIEGYTGAYPIFDYGTSTTPWTFSATAGGAPGRTAVEARDKVIQRGKQVMDAAAAAWPTVKIWTTYGPPSSEDITWTSPTGQNWGANTAWANELVGCFDYGMAQSTYTNTNATYLDGAEATYEIRDQTRADRARNWFKTGWADNSPFLIPNTERTTYKSRMSYAPAMYDLDALNGYALHTPTNMQTYLTLSMATADRYAWFYTEFHEWGASASGKPLVTQPYIDAVANARLAAR